MYKRQDQAFGEYTIHQKSGISGKDVHQRFFGHCVVADGRIVLLREALNLLAAADGMFPNGIGNSGGLVGKYIMDTVGGNWGGQIPLLENLPPHNEDGAGGLHVYAPWWLYKEQKAGKLGFARGYHIEFGTGKGMPGGRMGFGNDTGGRTSYGTRLKEDARRYYGSYIGFSGRGEMVPNDDSFCEIDPKVVDKLSLIHI